MNSRRPRPATAITRLALALAATIAASFVLASCESTTASKYERKSTVPRTVQLRQSTGHF